MCLHDPSWLLLRSLGSLRLALGGQSSWLSCCRCCGCLSPGLSLRLLNFIALLLLQWLELDHRCFVHFRDALFFVLWRFGLVRDIIYFAAVGARPFWGIKALDSNYVRWGGCAY